MRAPQSKPITKPQIRAIKTLQSRLRMDDESYRAWLGEAYGVDSCTALTSDEAGNAIEALGSILDKGQPLYLSGRDAWVRMGAWMEELFSAGALRGLADAERGEPPTHKAVKHVGGMLWELCGYLYKRRKIDNPLGYAKRIIRDATGRWGKIATAQECNAVRKAILSALRQRGLEYKGGQNGIRKVPGGEGK